jgi:hypothetical protein
MLPANFKLDTIVLVLELRGVVRMPRQMAL